MTARRTPMREEYESIREEILQWQEYRFLVLGAATALIAGVLAFELKDISEHWVGISAMLVCFVALAEMLSWYAGDDNAKAAAYLVVYYEEAAAEPGKGQGWETRRSLAKKLEVFPQHGLVMTLNLWLVVVYFLLGAVSVLLPFNAAEKGVTPVLLLEHFTLEHFTLEQFMLGVFALVWVYGLILLALPSRADKYLAAWRKVLEEERKRAATKTQALNTRAASE
jgi:hypothetical protein